MNTSGSLNENNKLPPAAASSSSSWEEEDANHPNTNSINLKKRKAGHYCREYYGGGGCGGGHTTSDRGGVGRICGDCGQSKSPFDFSKRQKKKGAEARCRDCVDKSCGGSNNKPANTTTTSRLHKCRGCHRFKHALKSFTPEQLQKGPGAICMACVSLQEETESKIAFCITCCIDLPQKEFSKTEWDKNFAYGYPMICLDCENKEELQEETKSKIAFCECCCRDLPQKRFSKSEWEENIAQGYFGVCLDCRNKEELPTYKCSRTDCSNEYFCHRLNRSSKKRKQVKKTLIEHDGEFVCYECQEEIERLKLRTVMCVQCKESKLKDCFSSTQWVGWNPSCLVCLPEEKEKELEREKKDRFWNRVKKDYISNSKKGVIYYNYDSEKVQQSLGVDEPKDLLDKYSILYCFGSSGECDSRTTRGTITLKKYTPSDPNNNSSSSSTTTTTTSNIQALPLLPGGVAPAPAMARNEESNSGEDLTTTTTTKFEAQIEFDKKIPSSCCGWFDASGIIRGVGSPYHRSSPWCMEFDDFVKESFDAKVRELIFDHASARLGVVKKRLAFPWTPLEQSYNWPDPSHDLPDVLRDDSKFVRFSTLEEAGVLTQEYQAKGNSPPSWISNHLGVSPEIAKHIHSFAVNWKPPPVLYVEPGDLIMTFSWNGPIASQLLLRKIT